MSFIDDLAHKSPTPGGGAAAARCAALGTALLHKIVKVLESRDRDESSPTWGIFRGKLMSLLETFSRLEEEDSASYRELSRELQNGSGASRDRAVQGSLDPPLGIMEHALETLRLLHQARIAGPRYVLSDLWCAWNSWPRLTRARQPSPEPIRDCSTTAGPRAVSKTASPINVLPSAPCKRSCQNHYLLLKRVVKSTYAPRNAFAAGSTAPKGKCVTKCNLVTSPGYCSCRREKCMHSSRGALIGICGIERLAAGFSTLPSTTSTTRGQPAFQRPGAHISLSPLFEFGPA